jgi:hypothetical protein
MARLHSVESLLKLEEHELPKAIEEVFDTHAGYRQATVRHLSVGEILRKAYRFGYNYCRAERQLYRKRIMTVEEFCR